MDEELEKKEEEKNFIVSFHNLKFQKQSKKLKYNLKPNLLKDFEIKFNIYTYNFGREGYFDTLKWLFANDFTFTLFEQTSHFVRSLNGKNLAVLKVSEPNLTKLNGKRINEERFGKLAVYIKGNELYGFVERKFLNKEEFVDKFIYLGLVEGDVK